jgi:hypothetical protein
MRPSGIPGAPLVLTLAGLVPFIAGAAVMWLPQTGPVLRAQAALCLLVYAGMFLSFAGGVRWGAGIHAQGEGRPQTRLVALSVLGMTAGWGLVLAGVLGALDWPVFAAAAAAHALQGVWDASGTGLPVWFRRLRLSGALAAATALAAAAGAYLFQ